MLKFLLIIILVGYVFIKASSFVLNILSGGTRSGYNKQTRSTNKGDIHVDKQTAESHNKHSDFKGGEYIDYEEVDS